MRWTFNQLSEIVSRRFGSCWATAAAINPLLRRERAARPQTVQYVLNPIIELSMQMR